MNKPSRFTRFQTASMNSRISVNRPVTGLPWSGGFQKAGGHIRELTCLWTGAAQEGCGHPMEPANVMERQP